MFFRSKKSGNQTYLQLVENKWDSGKTRQRVVATVGRLDKMQKSGDLESLLNSGARFCKNYFSIFSSFDDESQLTSHQVGKLLQVSPSTVVGWINQGRLPASRTPGGHRRIRVADVRRFLDQHRMPVPTPLQSDESTHRIFVVDDEPAVIRTIQRICERYNPAWDVQGCADGIEALVQIGALQPDLVLLDIYMEGIDGFEVCRRLKRIPSLAELRIVAMTAYPSDEARARILDYGAIDYWVKPIQAEQVEAILPRQAIRQRPAPS